jgi:hypothetical protein
MGKALYLEIRLSLSLINAVDKAMTEGITLFSVEILNILLKVLKEICDRCRVIPYIPIVTGYP